MKQVFRLVVSSNVRMPSSCYRFSLITSILFLFFVQAQFDVYRKEKKRHSRAVVCELDNVDGRLVGIWFQYKDGVKEWMEFGARTIFPFRSKLKKREARARKNAADNSKTLSVDERNRDTRPDIDGESKPEMTQSFDERHRDIRPGIVGEGTMMNIEIESTIAPDVNDHRNSNNIMNPPPHNVTNINGNSNIGRSYDQYSIAVSSMSHATLPTHRMRDFITHSDVAPYTSGSNRILQQQHGLDDHNNQMQDQHEAEPSKSNAPTEALGLQPAPTSEAPLSTIYGSGGSIPPGWSGLDILAAVTFGAAATIGATTTFGTGATSTATTSVDPASSAVAASLNNTSSSGHGQSSFGWEGTGNVFNNHDRTYDSGNYHEPTLQNQQRYMPIWAQQEQQQYQSLNQGQRWYPTVDNFRMSQQQVVPVFPTGAVTNGYDRLNHSAVSQQPQLHQPQEQHQWLNTTLLDGNINGSNNSSK